MTVDNRNDIVDVLLQQHQQLRELCAAVHAASNDERKQLFGDLARLLHLHDLGEQAVVHPATRDQTSRGGEAIAVACAAEEDRVGWAIGDLEGLGVDHPAFVAKFAAFHHAVLDHLAHEEREEFPLLRRYVPTQRLHAMAGHLRAVQALS